MCQSMVWKRERLDLPCDEMQLTSGEQEKAIYRTTTDRASWLLALDGWLDG